MRDRQTDKMRRWVNKHNVVVIIWFLKTVFLKYNYHAFISVKVVTPNMLNMLNVLNRRFGTILSYS
jgi:hypothetical protein